MEAWVIQGGMACIVGLLWYLLRQKDDQQAKEISTLWAKHDANVKDLQELRLQIASRHYERSELDQKFDKLDRSITEGFSALGTDFKRLSDALLKHISIEEGRKDHKCSQ